MPAVKVYRNDLSIEVNSPYSPDLPSRAKLLSGKWDRENTAWSFPIAAEPQIKELYLDIYGEWDDMPIDTVNLMCVCSGAYMEKCSLALGGRIIASATGRDSGARTAPGVIVLEGKFTSGGSVKNWRTICKEGTMFRLLNVPRAKALSLVANPEWCSSIEFEENTTIDRNALTAERARLMARVTEIDTILNRGV
jgi:hypothetical protein